MPSYLHSYTFL